MSSIASRQALYPKPICGVATFATPAQFFTAMFGPEQHDSHVKVRRVHRTTLERIAGLAAAKEAEAKRFAQRATENAEYWASQRARLLQAAE